MHEMLAYSRESINLLSPSIPLSWPSSPHVPYVRTCPELSDGPSSFGPLPKLLRPFPLRSTSIAIGRGGGERWDCDDPADSEYIEASRPSNPRCRVRPGALRRRGGGSRAEDGLSSRGCVSPSLLESIDDVQESWKGDENHADPENGRRPCLLPLHPSHDDQHETQKCRDGDQVSHDFPPFRFEMIAGSCLGLYDRRCRLPGSIDVTSRLARVSPVDASTPS